MATPDQRPSQATKKESANTACSHSEERAAAEVYVHGVEPSDKSMRERQVKLHKLNDKDREKRRDQLKRHAS